MLCLHPNHQLLKVEIQFVQFAGDVCLRNKLRGPAPLPFTDTSAVPRHKNSGQSVTLMDTLPAELIGAMNQ